MSRDGDRRVGPDYGEAIWMFLSSRATYAQKDVVRLIGIPQTYLQNWANRKIIEGSVSEGKHKKRRYAPIDVVHIYIAWHLVALDLPPADAMAVAIGVMLEAYWRPRQRQAEALAEGETAELDFDRNHVAILPRAGERDLPRMFLVEENKLSEFITSQTAPVIIVSPWTMLWQLVERMVTLNISLAPE